MLISSQSHVNMARCCAPVVVSEAVLAALAPPPPPPPVLALSGAYRNFSNLQREDSLCMLSMLNCGYPGKPF